MPKVFLPKSHFASAMILALLFVAVSTPSNSAVAQPYERLSREGGCVADVERDPYQFSPLSWTALQPVIYPVKSTDGLIHLEYVLKVSNDWNVGASIDSVEVLDAKTQAVTGHNRVVAIDGVDVTGKIRPVELMEAPEQDYTHSDYSDRLEKGRAGILFTDLTYRSMQEVPTCLKHRLTVRYTEGPEVNRTWVAVDTGMPVRRKKALAITPPLTGPGWYNGNGAGPIIAAHRYGVAPANGRLHPIEQFAIDFMRLQEGPNDQWAIVNGGDLKTNESFYSYGQEVLSATKGRVIEVVDKFPDETPGELHLPEDFDDYGGNRVVVAIGGGGYAYYAHLKPGSIMVKPGQRIQAGHLLGKVGNSGSSTAPHLHFQIMDNPKALNSTSLPFVFNRMTFQGKVTGHWDSVDDAVEAGESVVMDVTGSGLRKLEMPLTLDVVTFPDREPRH